MPKYRKSPATIKKIEDQFKKICHDNKYAIRDIQEHARFDFLVDRRKHIAKILNSDGYSLPLISHVLKRDHTTIRYYLGRKKSV